MQLPSHIGVMNKCEEHFYDSASHPQLFIQFVKAHLALHISLYVWGFIKPQIIQNKKLNSMGAALHLIHPRWNSQLPT